MSDHVVKLALEWIPNTIHTGFYEAIDRGYYSDEGLDVRIFMPDDHGDGRQWLLDRRTDFAITEQMSMSDFFFKDSKTPLTAVAALMNHNQSGLLTNYKIKSPKDLTMGTYATFGYPTEQRIIRDTINSDGGDFSKIKLVSNDMIFDPISDLKQFKYDGVFVYHHWEGKMASLDEPDKFNFFFVKDYVPEFDYYTPVIAANTNYLNNHGDLTRRFLRASAKGYAAAKDNPEHACRTLMRYVPDRMLQSNLVANSQQEVSKNYRVNDGVFIPIENRIWKSFYVWLNKQNLGKPFDPSIGFSNAYLK